MRYIHLVIVAVFAAMAAIQYKDPDAIYWIVVYGATAWVAGAAAYGHASRLWTGVTMGLALAGMLIALPDFWDYLKSGNLDSITGTMWPGSPVDGAREFLGSTFSLSVLIFYLNKFR